MFCPRCHRQLPAGYRYCPYTPTSKLGRRVAGSLLRALARELPA